MVDIWQDAKWQGRYLPALFADNQMNGNNYFLVHVYIKIVDSQPKKALLLFLTKEEETIAHKIQNNA